jgi:hypothetical protein
MKFRRLVILLAAAMPLVCAAQSDFVNEQMHGKPPLHPTVLLTAYKGEEEPIISVRVDEPRVEVEHKQHMISRSASFQPIRGAAFAPGSIQITGEHADSKYMQEVFYNSGGDRGGHWDDHSDFQATLTPSESYQDCYMAVLFYDAKFMKGTQPLPSISVVFQEVGDLVAGKPKTVKMRFAYIDPSKTPNLTFFPLMFTHGEEIKTNHSELSARFFRRLELMRHEKMVADYKSKNVGKDAPLKPYVRIMPKFPDNLDVSKLPPVIKTSFMVDSDGTVYSVQIEDAIDKEAEEAIHQALGGWLFFPRLKDGHGERTMVRVPLQLHPATKTS